ncbi:transglycosylase SLT domain-containing protein [Streptomyces sp. NPDC006487]|uniref:transglycosylase SLT domain-containing protein n=1 Tax=Streptomyces sp. NPDC006487 TaxID=3364748 RepID=UPI00368744E3
MPARAKHRRPNNSQLSRKFLAVGTGGAALALPLLGATAAEAAPNKSRASKPLAAPTAPSAPKGHITYSVVAGDSLSGIAEKHKVTGGWQKLHGANRAVVGDNPSLIRPGMKLRVDVARGKAPTTSPAKTPAKAPAAGKTYADNLDGWIRGALDVMAANGIPGSYDGIHRNIMRESSGNPNAVNNWDSNAAKGTPSQGLLQVIDPTFKEHYVPGTKFDPFDPVANIAAACNYAAKRYGSIDNVNGPY